MPVNKDFYPIAGSSGAQSTGYTINQSIRFNDDNVATACILEVEYTT